MEKKNAEIRFEEVSESESDDIWEILFPSIAEKREAINTFTQGEKKKPRRYLRFLSI